jgi:RNA polymerase sigma factor (sigma-70 family)
MNTDADHPTWGGSREEVVSPLRSRRVQDYPVALFEHEPRSEGDVEGSGRTRAPSPGEAVSADRSAARTSAQTVAEWLESPYVGRVASRVGYQYGLLSHEVPDLLQELRLALWKAGLSLSVSPAWLFQTASHKAIDLLKARRRRAEVALEPHTLPASASAVDLTLSCLLRSQADRLPGDLRRFYALRYEQGLSQREVAQRLGMCRGAVRTLDRRCLRRIGALHRGDPGPGTSGATRPEPPRRTRTRRAPGVTSGPAEKRG